MNIPKPATTVQLEFASTPSAANRPQPAVFIGPQRRVFDISDDDDKTAISLGAYDPEDEVEYAYPSKPALCIVEQDTVSLYLAKVWAKYATLSGADVIERGSVANRITLGDNATDGFAETSSGDRNGVFRERDVKVGDRLLITSGSDEYETRVTKLIREVVAATVGSISNHTSNQATVTKVVTPATIVANDDHAMTENTATTVYKGSLAGGWISDTYTVQVTKAGAPGVAKLRVTSEKGDNVSGVSTVAFGTAFNVGTHGLRVKIDSTSEADFVVGEKYTIEARAAFTQHTPAIISSDYTGAQDAVYTVIVSKGGLWSEGPKVRVKTNNGSDSAKSITVALNTTFEVGTNDVTMRFNDSVTQDGLLYGDAYRFTVTASADGETRTLMIANALPDTIVEGDDLAVDFNLYIEDPFALPAASYPEAGSEAYTVDEDGIVLSAAIEILNSTWVDDQGDQLSIPVTKADLYLKYSALLVGKSNQLIPISKASLIEATLGKIVPFNMVAYAADIGLKNSNGRTVYVMPISSNDADGYAEAFNALESERAVYAAVILTRTQSIIDLLEAAVDRSKDPESGVRPRYGFACKSASTTDALYSRNPEGDLWVGYVGLEPGSSPAAYNQVTVPGAEFQTDGVRAGDLFRTSYDVDDNGTTTYVEKVILSVTDQENLVLDGVGFSEAVGDEDNQERISIIRPLTKDELADKIALQSSALGNNNISNLWPSEFVDQQNQSVSGVYLGAAIAALKSSVVPHQPITNFTLVGVKSVPLSFNYFTPAQLTTIAEGGTLVVTQDGTNGPCYIRHQLTTDTTDELHYEMSATYNSDAIALRLKEVTEDVNGRYNNVESTRQLIETRIIAELDDLKANNTTETAGPQIVEFDIQGINVIQDELRKTKAKTNVPITIPLPLNNTEINLQIS